MCLRARACVRAFVGVSNVSQRRGEVACTVGSVAVGVVDRYSIPTHTHTHLYQHMLIFTKTPSSLPHSLPLSLPLSPWC